MLALPWVKSEDKFTITVGYRKLSYIKNYTRYRSALFGPLSSALSIFMTMSILDIWSTLLDSLCIKIK